MQESTHPQPGPAQTTPAFPPAFDLFSPSVNAIITNIGTFLLLVVVPVVSFIVFALLFILNMLRTSGTTESILPTFGHVIAFLLIMACIYVWVMPMFTYAQLRSAQGIKVDLSDTFQGIKPYFWRLLGLRIILGFIYFAGLILLVVPFFFFWKRYMLARYYLIDQNLSIGHAMKASAAHAARYPDAVWGLVGVRILWWFVTQLFMPVGSALDFLYGCAPALRYLQFKELDESPPAAKQAQVAR